MTDRDIIADFLAGDSRIIHRVQQWIRGACTPYRRQLAPEVEDLEQEILLELTEALRNDRFRGQSRLETYVRTFVHHKCIDRVRARRRREWIDIDELELPATLPSAYDLLSRSQTMALALRVQEAMPEACRELWRHLEEGLSYREMSLRTGVAEGALRARMLRCRRKALELRQRLLQAATPRSPEEGPKDSHGPRTSPAAKKSPFPRNEIDATTTKAPNEA